MASSQVSASIKPLVSVLSRSVYNNATQKKNTSRISVATAHFKRIYRQFL